MVFTSKGTEFNAGPASSFDLNIVPGKTQGSLQPSALQINKLDLKRLNLPYFYPKEWASTISEGFSKIEGLIPKLDSQQLTALTGFLSVSGEGTADTLKVFNFTTEEGKEFLQILKKVRLIAKRYEDNPFFRRVSKLSGSLIRDVLRDTPESVSLENRLSSGFQAIGKEYKEAAEYLSTNSVDALISDPVTSEGGYKAFVKINAENSEQPIDVSFGKPVTSFGAGTIIPGLDVGVGSVQFRPDAIFNSSTTTAKTSELLSVNVNLKDVKIVSDNSKAEDLVFTGKGSSTQSLPRFLLTGSATGSLPSFLGNYPDDYFSTITDFDDPKAYIKINSKTSQSEIAARMGLKGFAIPKVASIDEASILKVINKPIDLANLEVQGKVTIGLLSDLSLAGKLTVRDYIPDTIIGEADNINKPIVAGIYLQRVKLGAANISNPNKPLTFTGGASATFGPPGFKLLSPGSSSGGWLSQSKFKPLANLFDKALGSLTLARADGDFAFNKEGFAGRTKVNLLGLIDVSQTDLAVNIKNRAFGYTSKGPVLSLLEGTIGVRANLGKEGGDPPQVSVFFEGQPSNFLKKFDFVADLSARGLLKFSDDSNYSNDYVAVWGRATALKGLKFANLDIDKSAGFKLNFDGGVDSFAGNTERVAGNAVNLNVDFALESGFTSSELQRLFQDVQIPSSTRIASSVSIPSNVRNPSKSKRLSGRFSKQINGEDNEIETLPVDSGNLPFDDGISPTDSGALPTDSGTLPTDSGALPTDSGTLPTDSGTLPFDDGISPTDSGTLPFDDGISPTDSGTLPFDNGTLDDPISNTNDETNLALLQQELQEDLGYSNNVLDDELYDQLADQIEEQNEEAFAEPDNSGDTNNDGVFDEADLPFDEDGVFEGLDSFDEDELDDEEPELINPTASFIASFDVPANNEYVTFVVNWENRVDERPFFALRGPDGEIYNRQDLTDVTYLSSEDPNDSDEDPNDSGDELNNVQSARLAQAVVDEDDPNNAELATLPKVIVDEDASNDFSLEIIVPKPMAGTWDLAMLDTEDLGKMKVFMEDPKEDTTLELGNPVVDEQTGEVTIPYTVTAPDYSPSTIQFFRDEDGEGKGYPISEEIEVPSGVTESSFTWDASELGSDKHYIYALITPTDSPPVRVYADQPAEVTEPGSLPQVTDVGASYIGDNQVQVTWTKVPEAQAYLITYSSNAAHPEDEDSSTTVQVTGFVNSVILSDLTPGETYAIHVRAIDQEDDFTLESSDALVTVGEFTGQDTTQTDEVSVFAEGGQLYTQTLDLGEDVESVDILEAPETAEFDPANQVFSWQVPQEAGGLYEVSLKVKQIDGNEVLKNFQVFVGTPVPAELSDDDDFNGFATNGTSDNYEGGIEDDVALGGDGNDELVASFGDDELYGNTGFDLLDGGSGDDAIYGGKGIDSIAGGDGEDELYGDLGNDSIWGNAGDENLYGGEGNDLVYGGEGIDYLWGETGDDSLFGESGSDVAYGDEGSDLITGGENGDELHGNADNDTLNGNVGEDTLYGGQGNDSLTGNEYNDLLVAGRGNDFLTGDDGDDLLRGSDLNTGSEVDTLTGGAGADQFWLSEDGKTALYSTAGEGDYTLITDFDPNVDQLILPGDNDALDPLTQYRFAQQPATSMTPDGLAVFVRKSDGSEDLIAILQGTQPLTPESLLNPATSSPDALVSLNRPIQLFFGNSTGLPVESLPGTQPDSQLEEVLV